MINITFLIYGEFDLTQISEQWHEYVTITQIGSKPLLYSRVSIGVQPDDSSYRYRALMQPQQLVLKFSLPFYYEFPVGSSVVFDGQTFYIKRPQDIKKQGERNIEYSMTLYADDSNLSNYKMRNTVDGRLKWSMCARPHEFIEEIVKNLNEREGKDKWSVGTCIDATEKTVEFNHTYLDAALTDIANAFETEWEIVDKVINLCKVEYFKDEPLPLSYGRGNGFVPGLGRTTSTEGEPIKRIYTQGGTRNIDRSKYGGVDVNGNYSTVFPYRISSAELLLPASQSLTYEGRTYQTDPNGYYVERVDKKSTATKEDSLDCSEIYPKRVGKITAVELGSEKDAERLHFYDIFDTTIPQSLNYNDYLIEGETPTVTFQSGMLSGKSFEFKYVHDERRFKIVPQEIDGITMPDPKTGYMPKVRDEYAIFGVMLPQAYICDNATQTGASWDMFRAAAKKLYESEDTKFTFNGEIQGLWAKRNWLLVGGRLKVGAYIFFSDEQFAKDGLAIRIVSVKDYVNNPYSPTIEISNSVTGTSITSELRKIDNTEVVIEDTGNSIVQYTKRRFRDAEETIEMLNNAMLGNFTEQVSPIAVLTMALLVGDESLQFEFVKSVTEQVPTALRPIYKNDTKTMYVPRMAIRHLTLGINSISSQHSNYLCWQMGEWASATLNDSNARYYVYAKVNRNDTAAIGEYFLSEKAVDLYGVEGYYVLLVGILNSEVDEERSFVELHGFTEILPGRITTDRIVSSAGDSYFDLAANAMKLGNALDFNSAGDGKLRLRGTIVQSQSGDSDYIGCFRGEYNPSNTYYQGDEVTYAIYGCTSTYRYIYPTETSGISPTDVEHWEVVAQGSKGEKGDKGDSPALVFQGDYNPHKTYYGTPNRVDAVRYQGSYYVALTDAGEFYGTAPNNTSKWDTFGATFDSVATLLLLAEYANIGNFVIKNNCLMSQKGTINGVESTDFTNDAFVPNIMLDGLNGISVISGSLRNPFVEWSSERNVFDGDIKNGVGRYDNVVMPITSNSTDERELEPDQFTWTADNSGRIIRIINYKWSTGTAVGRVTLKAPTGKYFYENGKARTQIIMSRECLVLAGYGTPTTFYGWVVLARVDVYTEGSYGAPLKVLYQGIFNPNATYYIDKIWSESLANSGIEEKTWGVKILDAGGKYRIYLPTFLSSSSWHVMLTPCSVGVSGSIASNVRYACLMAKGAETVDGVNKSYFDVWTADDSSVIPGGFLFQVIGIHNWVSPTATAAASEASALSAEDEQENITPIVKSEFTSIDDKFKLQVIE